MKSFDLFKNNYVFRKKQVGVISGKLGHCFAIEMTEKNDPNYPELTPNCLCE